MKIQTSVVLSLVFLFVVASMVAAQEQPPNTFERIIILEAEMRQIRQSVARIEKTLESLARANWAPTTLELLILALLTGDKASYWIKRRNGTWEGKKK